MSYITFNPFGGGGWALGPVTPTPPATPTPKIAEGCDDDSGQITTMTGAAKTDAEAEDRPTLADDFCYCAMWSQYYGVPQSCAKCKNSSIEAIRQHVVELMEEAATWIANNGNIALSREVFDTVEVVKRSWR